MRTGQAGTGRDRETAEPAGASARVPGHALRGWLGFPVQREGHVLPPRWDLAPTVVVPLRMRTVWKRAEGGELGYALSHVYGAAFDHPGLLVVASRVMPGQVSVYVPSSQELARTAGLPWPGPQTHRASRDRSLTTWFRVGVQRDRGRGRPGGRGAEA